MIRAIYFDVGETLVFDHPTRDERVAAALSAVGVPFAPVALERSLRAAQTYGMEQYLVGRPPDDPSVATELLRIVVDAVGGAVDDATIRAIGQYYAGLPFERVLDPSVVPMLEGLRGRGFKTGVISDWEPDLPDLLLKLGCRHLLDSVSVSSLVGAVKPSPKLFRNALDQLRVASHEAMHIGDYLELDVAGARAVGMDAVLYDWRGRHERETAGVPLVRTIAELARLLTALPAP